MLKLIDGLPDNVLGVSAEGKVSGTDYKTVLVPAAEEKFKAHKKIGFLYHLGSPFTGFELGALVQDGRVGIKHLFSWKKIALVSDHKMIDYLVRFFGFIMPCKVRIFKNAELQEAEKWVAEK